MTTHKKCNKCEEWLELASFGKDTRNKDGLQGICEPCRKVKKQEDRDKRMSGLNVTVVSEKTCNKCNELKPIDAFFKDAGISDGHATICKQCKTEGSLGWREKNREKYNATARAYNKKHYSRLRLQRYSLSVEEYNQKLVEQNNKCAICRKPPNGIRPLAVDHSHETGKVRGLLCYGCNRALHILESKELLVKAIAYLDGYK